MNKLSEDTYGKINKILEFYKGQTPVPIVDIANKLGIKLYETRDMQENELGAITKKGDDYVVYLNRDENIARKRFTIAHEIGHYLLHRKFIEKGNELIDRAEQPLLTSLALKRTTGIKNDEKMEMEIAANQIAAELLMPEAQFKSIWETSNNIEEVAKHFNVSISAATVRARDLLNVFLM